MKVTNLLISSQSKDKPNFKVRTCLFIFLSVRGEWEWKQTCLSMSIKSIVILFLKEWVSSQEGWAVCKVEEEAEVISPTRKPSNHNTRNNVPLLLVSLYRSSRWQCKCVQLCRIIYLFFSPSDLGRSSTAFSFTIQQLIILLVMLSLSLSLRSWGAMFWQNVRIGLVLLVQNYTCSSIVHGTCLSEMDAVCSQYLLQQTSWTYFDVSLTNSPSSSVSLCLPGWTNWHSKECRQTDI